MAKPFYQRTGLVVLCILVGFLLLLGGTVFFTVGSARRKAASATPTPSLIPTASPTPTPLPNYHSLSFDPEVSALPGLMQAAEAQPELMGGDHWVDITPENLDLPGYVLFRHESLGYSYLKLPEGGYLRLGEQTQGCGVVNGVYADLNADDAPELLYTYTAETEAGPCARVGWLDLTTQENRTGAFLLQGADLALLEEGGRVLLYRAALSDTDSRGAYAIEFLAPLGELIEREDELFLLME